MVEDPETETTSPQIPRREALAKAAKLGGALVWSVPLVQTVNMRAAAALAGSPGPGEEPGGDEGGGDGGGSEGGSDLSGGNGGGSEGGAGSAGGSGGGGTTATPLQILDLRTVPNPIRLRGDRRLRISFLISAAATVRVKIVHGDRVVRRFQPRSLDAAGSVATRWNGRNHRGSDVPAGPYTIVVTALDGLGGLAEAKARIRVTS